MSLLLFVCVIPVCNPCISKMADLHNLLIEQWHMLGDKS